MRPRIAVTLTLKRHRPDEPEQFEHRDNDGTLAELGPGDRYLGFTPERP